MRNLAGGGLRKLARRGASLSVSLALLVVGSVAFGPSHPAGACSLAAVAADFDGTVVALNGSTATYRVVQVRPVTGADHDRVSEPGGIVVVRYDDARQAIRLHETYRVRGWAGGATGLDSQIAYDFHGDCGTGVGTTARDGSLLVSPSPGLGPVWPYAFAGLVLVGGGFFAVREVLSHRVNTVRQQRRRLPADRT